MTTFLLYSVKLSLCLTLFYLGYKLLLSKETFFYFNRKMLLAGLFVCLLLPLVSIKTETTGIIQQQMMRLERTLTDDERSRTIAASGETSFVTNGETDFSASRGTGFAPNRDDKQQPLLSFNQLLFLIFATGCVLNSCLLARSHISLWRLIRRGRKIRQDNYTIVLFDKPVVPFNYGSYIILSEEDYQEHPNAILIHELAHLQHVHSFDNAFIEFLTLIQWFNPFIWALKNEIRKVHEFQADAEVLESGIDVTGYQLLLVKKAVGARAYALVNSFNHSKLKTRIAMMTKKKSNGWAQSKFLLLLPIVALIVYVFARPKEAVEISTKPSLTAISVQPKPFRSIITTVIDNKGKELRSFKFEDKEASSMFSFNNENAETIDEITKWQKTLKTGRHYTLKIKAYSDTPMGVIFDIKHTFHSNNIYNVRYEFL